MDIETLLGVPAIIFAAIIGLAWVITQAQQQQASKPRQDRAPARRREAPQRPALAFPTYSHDSEEFRGALRSIDVPEEDGAERHYFAGYASVYGVRCTHGDIDVRGTYANTVKAGPANVQMLWSHEAGEVIGKWTEFRETEHGLYVCGFVSGETRKGREVIAAMKRGHKPGLSTGRASLIKSKQTPEGRVLLDLEPVREISVCNLPAVPGATAVSRTPVHSA